jgi:hypothetical protein
MFNVFTEVASIAISDYRYLLIGMNKLAPQQKAAMCDPNSPSLKITSALL